MSPKTARVVVVTALLAAVGCAGKPVDPLAADRARLLALEAEPLPPAFPAEATLVIGDEMLRVELERALAEAAAEAGALFEVPTRVGTLGLTSTARVDALGIAPSPGCEACATVSLVVVGELEGRLGPFSERLPWRVESAVPIELVLERGEASDRVLARVVRGAAPKADVSFGELPPLVGDELSALLADRLRALVERGLVPDVTLAEIPRGELLRVRGVRARPVAVGGRSALAVELAFVALERGRVEVLPDPAAGFSVVLPERTLLGLARAAALRAEPVDGFAAEPTAISVDGDRFSLELAVWRIGPEPVADRFRVEGRVVLDGGELKLIPERAREAGAPRFTLDPIELLVRARILDEVRAALSAALPATREQDVGLSRKLRVELEGVEGSAGALLVRGRARLLPLQRPAGPS